MSGFQKNPFSGIEYPPKGAGFIDTNSPSGELNIRKVESNVKQSRPKDMKEGFRPVFQIMITTCLRRSDDMPQMLLPLPTRPDLPHQVSGL